MARKTQTNESSRDDTLIKTGVFVLLAAVLAAGCVVGVRKAWQATASRPEFLVRPAEVALAGPWVRTEEMKKDFLRTDSTGILKSRVSIFAPGLTEQVAAAYAASPWVRRVLLVSKEFPNRLNIRLEIREPFALVQAGGKYYCVDADGALLSPQVYNLAGDRLLTLVPFITLGGDAGVASAAQQWDRPEVQEGLAMVRLCRNDLAGKVPVREIQLQRAGGEDSAVTAWLVLEAGPRVQWGRTPASVRSPVEMSSQSKAAALLAVTRKEGTQIGRFKTIDVRWTQPLCE